MTTATLHGTEHPADTPPGVSASSTERILRSFARLVGVANIFYLALTAGRIAEDASIAAPWWTPFAVVAVFGTGVALIGASFARDLRWTIRVAAVVAIAYPVVALTWWAAWTGDLVPAEHTLWLANVPILSSMAAAVVWRPAIVFWHMLVVSTLAQLTNHTPRDAPFLHLFFPELAFLLVVASAYVAASVVAIRTARTLDATIAATHAAASSAAAAQAREVERERFDALTHDTVLSTLLAAARQGGGDRLAAQARDTVARLDDLRVAAPDVEDVDATGLLAQVRSAVSEADENIRFRSDVSVRRPGPVFPADVVRALAAAAAEAVRNSVRHAGDAPRSVAVDVEDDALRVTVDDDGDGFDPATVDRHRLGIAVSIRGRMNQVPGGRADIRSAPGEGTTVTLSWERAQ